MSSYPELDFDFARSSENFGWKKYRVYSRVDFPIRLTLFPVYLVRGADLNQPRSIFLSEGTRALNRLLSFYHWLRPGCKYLTLNI